MDTPTLDAVEAALLKEGRTATAFCGLVRGMSVVSPEPDSVVAFVRVPGGVVSAGEPIAPPERLGAVTGRFVNWARGVAGAGHGADGADGGGDENGAGTRRKQRVSFFATEGRILATHPLRRWLIGEQPVWDPREWAQSLSTHRSLREQLRRARAKGVVCYRLGVNELQHTGWRSSMDALVQRWHATRSMPAMGFIVEVDLMAGAQWRRSYVAVREGRLVALLSMAPVPARAGWLLEHLLRDPDAPNGTAELLVDAAMRDMSDEGVEWATLGLAPLHGPVRWWLGVVRRFSRPLFNFAGLSAFKQKLRPGSWEPIYMAWPHGDRGWRAMLDGLRAFAGMPLWRFGLQTIARGPASLLRLLEILLGPWTLLLALAPTQPWFPSKQVHAAWVIFDIVLLLLLGQLRMFTARQGGVARGRAALLTRLLAIAVSTDAALTIVQALTWNLPRSSDPGDLAVLLLACMAPLLTVPVLWGASRRLKSLASEPPFCPLA